MAESVIFEQEQFDFFFFNMNDFLSLALIILVGASNTVMNKNFENGYRIPPYKL